MHDTPLRPDTPPALVHAQEAARLRQALKLVYDTMIANGEDHPWIPSAEAKNILPIVKQALGIKEEECSAS